MQNLILKLSFPPKPIQSAMYEPQHLLNLQDNGGGYGGGDANSWLSGEDHQSSPAHHRRNLSSLSNATTAVTASNLDRDLFDELVQIVPLVQSYFDRKANSSFTRRGSMVYTKTPSRESLSRKVVDKGRNAVQSIPVKKRRDLGDKDQGKHAGNDQDGGADGFSKFSSSALPSEKDREELAELREQVEDLQRKLSEKDEILKSAHGTVDELKSLTSEKENVLKATQIQLSDAKIKLADKQAALEKLQWEAATSNRKVEKLQEDLNTMQGEMSSYMVLFEGLSKNDYPLASDDYDISPYASHLPDMDPLDEMDKQKIEVAREAYIAAVAAAKEKQDEESIAKAAHARLHLLSFVTRTN